MEKKLINFLILQKHKNSKILFSQWGIQILAKQLASHNRLRKLSKEQKKRKTN